MTESNKGQACPYKFLLCQEGYCSGCQIYLDFTEHESKGDKILLCPICGRRLKRMFICAEVVQTWCEPCKQEIIPLPTPQGIR